MNADFFGQEAGIFIGEKDRGICIAKVSHPGYQGTWWTSDEYFVEIASGVDSSFVVLMCLVFDELCHEGQAYNRG